MKKRQKNINRSEKKDFRPMIFKLTRPHDGLGTKGKKIGENFSTFVNFQMTHFVCRILGRKIQF